MKKVKIISLIIAAAMLSAAVYAEDVEEVITAEEVVEVAYTTTASVTEQIEAQENVDAPEQLAEYLPDEDSLPEEEFPELGDIDKYLAQNGYPDYLSFIFNSGASINGYDPTSGEAYKPQMTYLWEVGLVNADAAKKTEIETLINRLYPIENKITFVDCTYSHAQREAMIPDIRETAKQLFPNLTGLDVYLILNAEQIGVNVAFPAGDNTDYEMVREKMYAMYGDVVFVSEFFESTDEFDGAIGGFVGGTIPEMGIPEMGMGAATEIAEEEAVGEIGVASDVDGEPAPPIGGDVDSAPAVGIDTTGEIAAITPAEKSADNTVLWICIAAALVIALGAVAFIYRAKLIPVFATSHGDVTAKKTGRKQLEEAVKNSEVVPDDSVLQAIKEKIEK